MGTRLNGLGEAVLTCTYSVSFELKYQKYQILSGKIFNFYTRKKFCILHGQVLVMSMQTENAHMKTKETYNFIYITFLDVH